MQTAAFHLVSTMGSKAIFLRCLYLLFNNNYSEKRNLKWAPRSFDDDETAKINEKEISYERVLKQLVNTK